MAVTDRVWKPARPSADAAVALHGSAVVAFFERVVAGMVGRGVLPYGSVAAVQDAAAVSVPAPHERLNQPGALLSRSDLRDLGLERRAVDAVFRVLPVVSLPGYARPFVR